MGGTTSKNHLEVSEEISERNVTLDNDKKKNDNMNVEQNNIDEERNNNLDLYLNDLCEQELNFKISNEEVVEIEKGIESLVHTIVKDTVHTPSFKFFKSPWNNTSMNEEDEKEVFYETHESFDNFDNKDNKRGKVHCQTNSNSNNKCNDKSQKTFSYIDYTYADDDNDIFYDAADDLQNGVHESKLNDKPYRKHIDLIGWKDAEMIHHTNEHINCNRQLVQQGFDILNVGSIYEKSKNHFPDEFDFIVIVGWSNKLRGLSFLRLFHNSLQAVLGRMKINKYCIKIGQNSEIYFDKYVTARGPASTLQFIYSRQHYENVKIHVDITPAVRMQNVKDHIKKETLLFKDWYEEIIRRNCCLAVYVQDSDQAFHKGTARITVTEFEIHLMKNVISSKHLKIYKLLKYFINGKDDNEKLKLMCEIITEFSFSDKHSKTMCSISSYVIKTFLFRHHYNCSKKDDKLAGCLLDILEDIEKHVTSLTSGLLGSEKYIIRVRTPLNQELEILRNDTHEINMKLGKAFRFMKERLHRIYESKDIYYYGDFKITSWAELANNVLRQ
jgi:hypothetical protein